MAVPAARQMSDDPWLGTAAGKVAGLSATFFSEPGVHIHGEVVGGFAGSGDGLNEAGVVPRHKDFVGVRSSPKISGQVPVALSAVRVPEFAEARIERVVMGFEVAS